MLAVEDAYAFADKLIGATTRVCRDYGVGDVVHEEPFSDQLCGRIKETLEDFRTKNIYWQADTATADKGRGRLSARTLTKTKEEPALGADVIMILDVETPSYSVRKGLLVQAKRLDVGKKMTSSELTRLLEQCERMLKITPASMVFLYSQQGVHAIPAAAVLAARHSDLYAVVTHDTLWLYFDFAICWFGDPRLQATDPLSLEGLRDRLDAEAAVRFIGRGVDLEVADR